MPSGSSSLAMVPGSSVLKMLPNSRFTVAQMALRASFLCWSRSWMTCAQGARQEAGGVSAWARYAVRGQEQHQQHVTAAAWHSAIPAA